MAADVQVPVQLGKPMKCCVKLLDIYNSEELKISSRRCKLSVKETTEVLCAGPDSGPDDVKFNETFYRLEY